MLWEALRLSEVWEVFGGFDVSMVCPLTGFADQSCLFFGWDDNASINY